MALGTNPMEIDGVIVLKSSEVPLGVQVLWDGKRLLGMSYIGTPLKGVRATHITLSPEDYELIVISVKSRQAAKARRAPTARQVVDRGYSY